MVNPTVRRLFPGSNTPKGFYSYYHDMIEVERANKIFIFKGGPGVGKSTFLKRLGQEMTDNGLRVEYHHCSSDSNSLDGVVVTDLGVALLDGMAPHVVDPKYPGAVDEIVNFGAFWDEAGIRSHRPRIIRLREHISESYQRGYRYLRAARTVYDEIETIHRSAVQKGALNQMATTLVEELLNDRWISPVPGRTRHLFGSAITSDGPMNHLETVIGPMGRKVIVSGRPGTGKATLVEKVAAHAIERGYFVECLHCPFDPEKTQHIVIPELDTAITTSVEPHLWQGPIDMIVDTDDALHLGSVNRRADGLQKAYDVYHSLLQLSINAFSDAKHAHMEIEGYYSPYMDFDALNPLYDDVLAQIKAIKEDPDALGFSQARESFR